jgi:hypothetical protein
MGKFMDVIVPGGSDVDNAGGTYSKITFDPYVPKTIGKALNLVWSEGGFIDMLNNPLIIEYHYKNREDYLISFLSPDEIASAKRNNQA